MTTGNGGGSPTGAPGPFAGEPARSIPASSALLPVPTSAETAAEAEHSAAGGGGGGDDWNAWSKSAEDELAATVPDREQRQEQKIDSLFAEMAPTYVQPKKLEPTRLHVRIHAGLQDAAANIPSCAHSIYWGRHLYLGPQARRQQLRPPGQPGRQRRLAAGRRRNVFRGRRRGKGSHARWPCVSLLAGMRLTATLIPAGGGAGRLGRERRQQQRVGRRRRRH